MANLNVTYDDLRNAGNHLINGKGDLESRLMELKALIDNLVSGGYVTSASSGAFHEQYAQFTQSATAAVSALDGLSGFLRQAADALQQTDEALASSIRGQ
ncbi:MAG: WXG100 family type VII secretion target [Demequina sp.]|uniref:WXG100 family type VII secretion target n=1 Tax=Demequina sp. TaxID=2050685 RepID=UPI00199D3072|nr:WXG100 family type VII secretion target [Demequina sp.]MBC7297572.1 WXG100 family type VII secretion target [Demequina sp.]